MNTPFLPDKILNTYERAYSIEMLWRTSKAEQASVEGRKLLSLALPPWQRPIVWTDVQQIAFIEGIFLGLGTGYYVINGRDYEKDGSLKPKSSWLLDGQQRITAIARFIDDQFCVFGDIYYSHLPEATRLKRFDHINFPRFELEYEADEEKLKTIYKRLSFGGTAHTQADMDLLNCTPPSD